jgi:hypothetical protein
MKWHGNTDVVGNLFATHDGEWKEEYLARERQSEKRCGAGAYRHDRSGVTGHGKVWFEPWFSTFSVLFSYHSQTPNAARSNSIRLNRLSSPKIRTFNLGDSRAAFCLVSAVQIVQ